MRAFLIPMMVGLLLPLGPGGCAESWLPPPPADDDADDDAADDDAGDDDAAGDDDGADDDTADDDTGDDDTVDDDTGDDDTGDDDTVDPCTGYRQSWPAGPYGHQIGDVLDDFPGMVDGQKQPRSLWDYYGDTSVIVLVVHNAINT